MTKFVNRSINLSLLFEELEAAGLSEHGITFAGFTRSPGRSDVYTVNAERRMIGRATTPGGKDLLDYANPGELRFKYTPPLDALRDAALDAVLAAHNAANFSRLQMNRQADRDVVPVLVSSFKKWDSMSRAEKDATLRQVIRLVVRLLDKTIDVV